MDEHVLGELLNVLLLLLELRLDREESGFGSADAPWNGELWDSCRWAYLARSSCLMNISSAAASRLVKASLGEESRQLYSSLECSSQDARLTLTGCHPVATSRIRDHRQP